MRMFTPRRCLATVALLASTLFPGCDASVDPDTGPTFIRFVNATPDALGPLRFNIEGAVVADLLRGESSEYLNAEPRTYVVTIADGANHWRVSDDLEVVRGLHQTLVAFGEARAPSGVLLGDEPGGPRAGQFLVRILHLAPSLTGAFDVYVAAPGTGIEAEAAAISGIAFPASQGYLGINAGSWHIVLTNTNTRDVVFDSPVINFAAGDIYTLIIINASDGSPEMITLRDGA